MGGTRRNGIENCCALNSFSFRRLSEEIRHAVQDVRRGLESPWRTSPFVSLPFSFFSSLTLITGFYWVLLGFTGFDWVLLGFTGF